MTADGQPFRYASQDGKYGYIRKVDGADTFFPFSNANLDINISSGRIIYNSEQLSGTFVLASQNSQGTICCGVLIKRIVGDFSHYYFSGYAYLYGSSDGEHWTEITSKGWGEDHTSDTMPIDIDVSTYNYTYIKGISTGFNTTVNISLVEF